MKIITLKYSFIPLLFFKFSFGQFEKQEQKLIELGKEILTYGNTTHRIKQNIKFDSILNHVLHSKESFEYPFDSIKSLSTIISPDSLFKIHNWSFPHQTTYRYFGYIHFKKNNKVVKLIDRSPFIRDYKYKKLSPKKWYGALYYKIILNEYKGLKIYTLFGWDINTPKVRKKIIEILTLDKNNNATFGKPIFYLGKYNQEYRNILPQEHRLVYEYSASSKMLLRYQKQKNRIIMSHLISLNPDIPKVMSIKGADDTFDALYFKNGKWVLKVNVTYIKSNIHKVK